MIGSIIKPMEKKIFLLNNFDICNEERIKPIGKIK